MNYLTRDCGGDGIIKPLDMFGGVGVERFALKALQRKV